MNSKKKIKFQRGIHIKDFLYGFFTLLLIFFLLFIFNIITISSNFSNELYKTSTKKNYDDTVQDVEFAITESNFRIVNRINIGESIQERKNNKFPKNEIILFCNLTIAEEMLKIESDYINYCPYKITITENDNEVIIGTRLLPTNSKSYDINKFSIKMNDILRKMVQYSASDDPFILDLDK